jgi:hypothetical protein
MIVVLIDMTKDAHLLHRAYEGIEDVTLLVNPSNEQVNRVLSERPHETLVCLGHGCQYGLFGPFCLFGIATPMVISDTTVDLLKDRELICIWCNADEFGRRHPELKGFFTSMFISNANEARCFGFDADEDDIFNEVTLFAERVNNLIKQEVPLYDWPERLRSEADLSKDYVKFNYEGLKCFNVHKPLLLFTLDPDILK